MDSPKVQRALISVSDKSGLVEFAQRLASLDIEIYSTGGTRRHLEEAGLQVKDVGEYTGFPEMMDGRVKTLHPKIFGGILGRRDRDDDLDSMNNHGIVPFELVIVNLYPFEQTITREGVTRSEAVEQIDIGGPSLVRAAAKNHRFVSIATAPSQYDSIASELEADGCTSWDLRRQLMVDAFRHTAQYDEVISSHFAALEEDADESPNELPEQIDWHLVRARGLRYGENPHQGAALYRFTSEGESGNQDGTLVGARQLNGKELSYNNLLDLDAAHAIARSLSDCGAAVIKHNNPCGAASAKSLVEAATNAMEGDPVSAFGSVLAFNQTVDVETAEFLSTPGLFVEAIAAPGFDEAAVEILTTKPKWRSNVRLLDLGTPKILAGQIQIRCIDGGLLAQHADNATQPEEDWKIVTDLEMDDELMAELRFGWAVCRHVKSNAITVSQNRSLCGVGAGQMSRIDSVEIAIRKAGHRAKGAILASDAFFPFPDSIEQAAEAGIQAVIQPGGSKKDPDVIAACNRLKIPMIFTGRRHFKH